MLILKLVFSLREFIVSVDWGEVGCVLLIVFVWWSGRVVELSVSVMVFVVIVFFICFDWVFVLERSFIWRLIYCGIELFLWFVVGLWWCLNIGVIMRRWFIELCGIMGFLFCG